MGGINELQAQRPNLIEPILFEKKYWGGETFAENNHFTIIFNTKDSKKPMYNKCAFVLSGPQSDWFH